MKKIIMIAITIGMLPVFTGCAAVLAGGGTALWQAGKVVSEEQVSMEKGVKAVESAFTADNITLEDKVSKNEVTQIRGKDENGTKVAVDVFAKGSSNAKIEIRYGLGEETPARDLLNLIKKRL